MTETPYRAVFMRGGTSKALMFRREDLPAEPAAWDAIFTGAMGSPDAYGRQLNGMGGGLSSLSKVCVVGPSARDDADVDYTFGQVQVGRAEVDYRVNCGNMSAAVGPFAVDEGIVPAGGDAARVRIFNTNTGKLIHASFPVAGGRAALEGDLEIPGVSGSGAPIRLDFLEPGGATTGRLLPTGSVRDALADATEVSMVDAANACVFVAAASLGLSGVELPDALEGAAEVMARLQQIRREASVAMGIAPDLARAAEVAAVPFVAFVAPPRDFTTLDGRRFAAATHDLTVRAISNGQPHRALPLTVALCAAVSARIAGTLPAEMLGKQVAPEAPLRLGMPSGVLTVGADVSQEGGVWTARSGSFYRTARRLFDGQVWSQA